MWMDKSQKHGCVFLNPCALSLRLTTLPKKIVIFKLRLYVVAPSFYGTTVRLQHTRVHFFHRVAHDFNLQLNYQSLPDSAI